MFYSDNVGSDIESASGEQLSLMDKGGVIEGALLELSHEHQLTVAVCHCLPTLIISYFYWLSSIGFHYNKFVW